jgi:hypothetical protein
LRPDASLRFNSSRSAGAEIRGVTAAEFAEHLRSQIGVSTKLVSDFGLKAE